MKPGVETPGDADDVIRLPADVKAEIAAAFDAKPEATLHFSGSVDLKEKGAEVDVEKRF